jgi:biotin operon repressor
MPEPADVAESMPEPADVAESMPEPADVAESMPDLQALREAAEKAAALIHADEPEPEPEAEPEASRRGRKPDPAVTERTAKVLAEVQKAGASGISKPKLAEVLEEKEQQVYTSLRALQKDGKVESKSLEGLGYRWVAL